MGFALAQAYIAKGQVVIVCEGEDVSIKMGKAEGSSDNSAGTVLLVFVRGAILEGFIFLHEGCTFIVQELNYDRGIR